MKKIFFLTALFLTAVTAHAVSTCETRVDKHQDATTLQRVNYCLTPEMIVSDAPQDPDLVYYGIVDKKPAAQKEETTSSRGQSYFKGSNVSVYRDYVGTNQFPELENDILSDKELQELREREELARSEAAQRLQGIKGSFSAEKPQRQDPAKTASFTLGTLKNDAKGISARLNKPGRMMRETEQLAEEETPTPQLSEETQEPVADNLAGEPPAELPDTQTSPLAGDDLLDDF